MITCLPVKQRDTTLCSSRLALQDLIDYNLKVCPTLIEGVQQLQDGLDCDAQHEHYREYVGCN